jgi:hypothetical protein
MNMNDKNINNNEEFENNDENLEFLSEIQDFDIPNKVLDESIPEESDSNEEKVSDTINKIKDRRKITKHGCIVGYWWGGG